MRIDVEPHWGALAQAVMQTRGAVMVVGARDTGKSTFATWVAVGGAQCGLQTWLVDADVGQSDVGPPCTIGATCVSDRLRENDLGGAPNVIPDSGTLRPHHLYFTGDVTPRGNLLASVVGTGALVKRAQDSGADLVIVNTTGFVEGGAAVALKTAKIDLVAPALLVAFEREAELSDILEPYQHTRRPRIIRSPVSRSVLERGPERRAATRRERWEQYLRQAAELSLDLADVGISGEERRLVLANDQRGRTIGLYDSEDNCVAVGFLLEVDAARGQVRLLAPCPGNGAPIARLHLGCRLSNSPLEPPPEP